MTALPVLRPVRAQARASYRVELDTAAESRAWDAFVAAAPGGHHAQSSLWARVKSVLGWGVTRLVVRDGDAIVGGVQLLTRPVGRLGKVGFAPRGPVLGSEDPALVAVLHEALLQFGRDARVRYLKMQPPADRHDLVAALRDRGWASSALEAAPTATVRVAVDRPAQEIMAGMRASTRNAVRKAGRKGVTVRTGGEADLPAFCAIVEATSRRQGFVAYPARYYDAMWRIFAESGLARLLVAEREGETLCGTLLLGFGDSVTYKMGGLADADTKVKASPAAHWAGLQWAHETGHRFYDFDGIDKAIAQAVQRGDELPEAAKRGVAYFKLGFGGQVALFPGALDISPNLLLRPAVRAAAPHLDRLLGVAHRALGRGD